MWDRKGLELITEIILIKLRQRGAFFYKIKQKFEGIEKELTKEEAWKNVRTRVIEIKHSMRCISLVEIVHIVIKEEKEYPYIEMIVGIRSLTGNNKEIIKTGLLKDFIYGEKTKVIIKSIKKERLNMSWKALLGSEKEKLKRNYIYIYGKADIYGQFFDFIDEYWANIEFGEIEVIQHKDREIIGIRERDNKDKYVLINLWNTFMKKEKIVQSEGKIYKKVKESYEKIGDIKDLIKQTPEILRNLQEEYPNQLGEIDINKIISDHYAEAARVVEKVPEILVTMLIKEEEKKE